MPDTPTHPQKQGNTNKGSITDPAYLRAQGAMKSAFKDGGDLLGGDLAHTISFLGKNCVKVTDKTISALRRHGWAATFPNLKSLTTTRDKLIAAFDRLGDARAKKDAARTRY